MLKISLAFVMLALAGNAHAQSDAAVLQALNNVNHEMSRCMAYYSVVAMCLDPKRDADLQKQIEAVRSTLIEQVFLTGQSAGMSQDAMQSRIKIEASEMQKLIENNCVNISSLFVRHANRCKQVVENGDSILKEYLYPPQ